MAHFYTSRSFSRPVLGHSYMVRIRMQVVWRTDGAPTTIWRPKSNCHMRGPIGLPFLKQVRSTFQSQGWPLRCSPNRLKLICLVYIPCCFWLGSFSVKKRWCQLLPSYVFQASPYDKIKYCGSSSRHATICHWVTIYPTSIIQVQKLVGVAGLNYQTGIYKIFFLTLELETCRKFVEKKTQISLFASKIQLKQYISAS